MTTLFGTTAVLAIPTPKKKLSLLPLLTVLFVLSYGLMTMLIVEQGAVIQSQRNLIKVLVPDSNELWGMRGKALSDKQTAKAQAQRGTQAPATRQAPADRIPSNQVPSNQAPSTQAGPQHRFPSRAGKVAKPETQVPPIPASDLTDQRRTLHTI